MFKFRFLRLRITLLVAVLITTLAVSRISLGKGLDIQKHKGLNFNAPAPVVVSTYLVGNAQSVFRKINFQRESKGLKRLLWDEKLAMLALDYSKKMADQDFFSHFDPDGRTIVDRAEELEIDNWLKLGENLYKSEGYIEPVDIAVDGWMKSPSHRANIIDPDWTHTGVGYFTTKDRKTFITQVFMKKE